MYQCTQLISLQLYISTMSPSKKNTARMNAERKLTKAKEYLAEQKV